MSKKEKKESVKAKLEKLKKVIKKLTKFEKVLKAKEKKIDKKLKMSDKLKKSEIKKLKKTFEAGDEISKKDLKKASVEKIKSKKGKSKDSKPQKAHKRKSKVSKNKADRKGNEPVLSFEKELIKDFYTDDYEGENLEKLEVETRPAVDDSPAKSVNLNSKDAVAFLRNLDASEDIDSFVAKDVRVTVKKAAQSRKNALKGK